jgi:hypothetical protein
MTTDNHAVSAGPVEVHRLLDARRDDSFKGTSPVAAPLEDYAGRHVSNVWDSETVILPWNGGLVTESLPDAKPAAHLLLLMPIGPDRFRRIAGDGSDMHEVTFTRDAAATVIAKVEFDQRSVRPAPAK